jgi:hypothetical protein
MKITIIIICVFTFSIVASAQFENQSAICRNYSTFSSKVTTKYKTTNSFDYESTLNEKITQDHISVNFPEQKSDTIASSNSQMRYIGYAELGYSAGIGNEGLSVLKLNVVNGYQINQYLSIGFGTGLRYFIGFDAAVLPIFANFRAHLANKKVSPYFSMDAGTTLNIFDGFRNIGALVSPTGGLSIRFHDNSTINFGIGYEMQGLTLYKNNGSSIKVNSNGLSFILGFSL